MATAKLYPPEDSRSPDHLIAHLSPEAQAYIRLSNSRFLVPNPASGAEDEARTSKRAVALESMWEKLSDDEREEIARLSPDFLILSREEQEAIEREFENFDPKKQLEEERAMAAEREAAKNERDTEPPGEPFVEPVIDDGDSDRPPAVEPEAAPVTELELSDAAKEYIKLSEQAIEPSDPGYPDYFKRVDGLWRSLSPEEQKRVDELVKQLVEREPTGS